jgi:hypothetical protein
MELSLRQLEANRFDPLNADRRFIASVPKFRETVEEYRMTMSLEGSSRKSLKEMDQFVGDFRKYFQETKVEGDFPDPAEFRDFTTEELSWETLTSAERVDTKLRQASLLIQQANVSNVVNIKAMLFLRGLDSELPPSPSPDLETEGHPRLVLRENLSLRSKPRARPFVVALESLVRIRDRESHLIDELGNARHLGNRILSTVSVMRW